MPAIRAAAIAIALFALATPFDAEAKKKHGKHWKKKGAHAAWVHRVDRRARLERDLAVLVAARPRLPDGSRIVLNAPARAVLRRAPSLPRPAAPLPRGDLATAQRRASAVDSFLRSHSPLQ